MITLDFFKTRPLSVSALNSFEWDPEQWYDKYILGKEEPPNMAMIYGKHFARAVELVKIKHPKKANLVVDVKGQKVKVFTYSKVEHPFKVNFGEIPLVGFADTFCDKTKRKFRDYKTTKTMWTQDKVDENSQAKMYLLMNYITNHVDPAECEFYFDIYLTEEGGDFNIKLQNPDKPITLKVRKHTLQDILEFGAYINTQVEAMIKYANEKETRKVN